MTENKTKLSKTILDMKFMKKSKERVEKEEDNARGTAMYSNDITDQMRKGEKFMIVEASIGACEKLLEGRFSYGGMNPEIERLMQQEESNRTNQIDKEKEVEVSDIEMAKRLNSIPKSDKITKIKNKNKKRTFKKPVDINLI